MDEVFAGLSHVQTGTYRLRPACKLDGIMASMRSTSEVRAYRQSLLLLLSAFQPPADDKESDEELRRKLLGHGFSHIYIDDCDLDA